MSAEHYGWADVGPTFGSAMPFGSCNAITRQGRPVTVCGWPRRADGTCPKGHAKQPEGASS